MNNDIFTKPLPFIILFLVVLTTVIGLLYPMGDPRRALGTYPQYLIFAISFIFFVKTFTSKTIQITSVHYSLLLFNIMLFVYGLFSMDIYRIAVLTYAFMSFFMFY